MKSNTMILGRLLLAASICVFVSSTGAAQNRSLEEQFLQDAPLGWEAYEDHFVNLQGTYQFDSYYGRPNALKLDRQELREFKIRDDCKVDISRATLVATGKSEHEAIVHNTRYAFRLKRESENGEWRFIEGIPLSDLESTTRMYEFVQMRLPVVTLTHLGTRSMRQIVANPQFQVVSATKDEIDGMPAVKIRFVMDESKGASKAVYGGVLIGGVIWCDPGRNWILLRHEYEERKGTTIARSEVHMDVPSDSEFPLPTKASHRQSAAGVQEEVAENRLVFNLDVRATLPPESEFTMSAFGLPELEWLAEQEAPSASSAWIWITVFGAVILLGGFAFFVLSRRRTNA